MASRTSLHLPLRSSLIHTHSSPSPSSLLLIRTLNSTKSKLIPSQQRHASSTADVKAKRKHFITPSLTRLTRFSLCDAMRYIRAFEVGYPPTSPKYEAHIKFRTLRTGPVIKDRVVLPHPVRSDLRVAVIMDPESPLADEVRRAGASLVGDVEHVLGDVLKAFDVKGGGKKGGKGGKKGEQAVAAANTEASAPSPPATTSEAQQPGGKIPFDRLVIHPNLLPSLTKTAAARILGPRGLMPSTKAGTVTPNLLQFVRESTASANYHERMGVVRLAVGQLGFAPEQVRDNIQFIVEKLKKDAVALVENAKTVGIERKEIHEIVLSSTHGPGFSLTGEFASKSGIKAEQLRVQQ